MDDVPAFYKLLVTQWELVKMFEKDGCRHVNLFEVEEGRVILRGKVMHPQSKATRTFTSEPLQMWSIQRLWDERTHSEEYRIWLGAAKALELDVWYMLDRQATVKYAETQGELLKLIGAFKALKGAISKGPCEGVEATWEWPGKTWDDINAEVILGWVEEIQIGARDLFERQPAFVIDNFLSTLPEPEDRYAGVLRRHCKKTSGYTIEEHFRYLERHGCLPPEIAKLREEQRLVIGSAVGDEGVEDEEDEEEDERGLLKKPVKCSLCGRQTRLYEDKTRIGLQHIVLYKGERVVLKPPSSPECVVPPETNGKGSFNPRDLESRQGAKTRQKLTSITCPLCPSTKWKLPEQADACERHLRAHQSKWNPTEFLSVNLYNQLRLRTGLEEALRGPG